MAFTKTKLTHRVSNADLTAASGSIEFTLTKRMTNGAETIVPASVTANLNASGELSQELTANNDAGTVPEDSQWRVDFRILGAEQETFYIVVPTGGGTVDLGSLLPQQPQGG
jgi:exo-beta-1,3-glucanase (GH17 family)